MANVSQSDERNLDGRILFKKCTLTLRLFAMHQTYSYAFSSILSLHPGLAQHTFTATSVSRHFPRWTFPMLPSPICFFSTCTLKGTPIISCQVVKQIV